MLSAIYIFFSIGTGFLLLRSVVRLPSRQSLILYSFAATGLGFGISSLIYFISFILHAPAISTLIVEIALCVFLALKIRSHRGEISVHEVSNSFTPGWVWLIFAGVLGLTLINTSIAFLTSAFQSPHGGGDAYMIWNLKARFLSRGDSANWQSVFSEHISYSHPDYPLLLSGFIARCWKLVGENVTVPIITHFLFAISTAGMLFGALFHFKSKLQATIAALVLLCTPFFWQSARNQFADMPLGFFFLASIIFLFLADEQPEAKTRSSYFVCSGTFASLAAWTKNEGILFFVVVLVVIAIRDNPLKNIRETTSKLFNFVLGAAPVMLILIAFKIFLVPTNDLVAAQGSETAARITDLSRYAIVAKTFFVYIFTFSNWGIVPISIGVVYMFVMAEGSKRLSTFVVTGTLIIALMLAGYFMIYINTHLELEGHLASSLNRLYLQLFPSTLFVVFMFLRTPEGYFASTQPSTAQPTIPG